MIRDIGRRQRRTSIAGVTSTRTLRQLTSIAVEPLEERQLLSFYFGPTTSRPILAGGTFFTASVSGGGFERIHRMAHGQYAIDLIGTNPNSTLSISAQTNRGRFSNSPLKIGQITVETGLLGAINAGAADLLGPVSTLNSSLSSIQFNSIGSNARLNVQGSLGAFSTPIVNLGPTGLFEVAGQLTGSLGGSITVNGGQLIVGSESTGTFSPSNLTVQNDGLVSIGGGLSGGINIGALSATTGGQVIISGALGGLNVGALTLNGGRLLVGGDVTAASSIGSIAVSNNGLLAFSRDVDGLTVNGNIALGSGGAMVVGRNLSSLLVNGDIQVGSGGGIDVGGNVSALTIVGAFQGQGSGSKTDLNVGLNLDNFDVEGGGADQGGIQNANINVGKSILGLSVAHGIFNSLISAGVTIDGTGNSSLATAGTVGADGVDAVLDSQITAGSSILDLTLNGNVRSEFPTSTTPTGYPTRIIAGVDHAGNFSQGGLIDNFQITGSLIDSVLAASVAPFGGDGTLPPTGYNTTPAVPVLTPGSPDNYDAPAGVIQGGPVSAPISYPNYSEASYFNETFTNIAWNTAIDPNIHATILAGGRINPSFASPPLSQAQIAQGSVPTQTVTTTPGGGSTTTTTFTTVTLPLPTKSTVLGGVISNTHGEEDDFAGVLAADTSVVFIGAIPSNK